MNSPKPSPRPAGNNQKSPSYLSQAKAELLKVIIEGYATSRQQAEEVTDKLWKFLSPKLVESYWNGVSAGASGRVKPKQKFTSLSRLPPQRSGPVRAEEGQ